MALKFYNTLTKQKEDFIPLRQGEVMMYNCGPTVYNYAHIGNFRSYIFADILRRYLEWKGYKVRQVMNLTDVGHMTIDDALEQGGEDKIESAAQKEGRSPKEIADFYTMAFFEDIGKLSIQKAYFYPRATDHIGEMQKIIQILLEKGLAYKRGGDVYFEISKFSGYGKLSGNTLKKLQAGKRVEIKEQKRSPHDFALWIHNPKHIMQWDSPWGKGYPGWHIECSAMSTAYLGETIDIHTGGEDNIFPHHECEIAQSEGSSGKKFVNYWMHTRHLLVNGKKMSKSLGNFYTLRDLIELGFHPREVRFLLLSANYRTRLNFTIKGLEGARETLQSMENFISAVRQSEGKETKKVSELIEKTRKSFEDAFDDDLNVSEALSSLFDFIRTVNSMLSKNHIGKQNAHDIISFMNEVDKILGLDMGKEEGWKTVHQAHGEIKQLIEEREKCRHEKNFEKADQIRLTLKNKGIMLEDSKEGVKWKQQ